MWRLEPQQKSLKDKQKNNNKKNLENKYRKKLYGYFKWVRREDLNWVRQEDLNWVRQEDLNREIESLLIVKVQLVTVVERGPKAPFSIATTLRCREGRYSFPWITPLYPWSVPYNAEC